MKKYRVLVKARKLKKRFIVVAETLADCISLIYEKTKTSLTGSEEVEILSTTPTNRVRHAIFCL